MKYERLYKCNLCQEVYTQETLEMKDKNKSDVLLLVKKRVNNIGHTDGKYPTELHECGGYTIGVSNFVGIKFIEK